MTTLDNLNQNVYKCYSNFGLGKQDREYFAATNDVGSDLGANFINEKNTQLNRDIVKVHPPRCRRQNFRPSLLQQ